MPELEPVEYRIEELATVSGTTVRTLQSYRNRGLLPPPRRQGRIALYSDEHVARLELIASLISRGYSLNAVAELLDGLGRGDKIHDLLGLEDAVVKPSEEPPPVLTLREIEALVGGGAGALAEAVKLGVIAPVDTEFDGKPGDRAYRVESPAVLEAAAALVATGIPLDAIVAEGFRLQRDADEIALRFVHLATDHVIQDGSLSPEARASSVTDLVGQLVPFAPVVVAEYVKLALTRHIQDEIDSQLGHLLDDE